MGCEAWYSLGMNNCNYVIKLSGGPYHGIEIGNPPPEENPDVGAEVICGDSVYLMYSKNIAIYIRKRNKHDAK